MRLNASHLRSEQGSLIAISWCVGRSVCGTSIGDSVPENVGFGQFEA